MANDFERMVGQCFENTRRPNLLTLAEHIGGAASGQPSPNAAGGLRLHFGKTLCAPLVFEALASAYSNSIGHLFFKSTGHPHIIKAASHYLL